jgi:hypothetical protein
MNNWSDEETDDPHYADRHTRLAHAGQPPICSLATRQPHRRQHRQAAGAFARGRSYTFHGSPRKRADVLI